MAWSRSQQMVVALLPKFSSVLSLFGSCWIIVEAITDQNPNRRKRNHPYHRLLFAMSVYDVLESLWNFTSSWPIPEGTEDVIWARGTTATCTAQGFFLTLSVAVPIYNAMLSLYYVLVINFRCSDAYLRRWVEPTMHLVAFTWAFGTAIWAATRKLINKYVRTLLHSLFVSMGNCEVAYQSSLDLVRIYGVGLLRILQIV